VFDPDPNKRIWAIASTRPPSGGVPEARANHTATMLAGGRVLLAGGSSDPSTTLGSAEIYENNRPTTGHWTLTPNQMRTPRHSHTATLLPTGLVLVAGGDTVVTGAISPTRSAELYDPNSGLWKLTGDLNFARFGHTATLLANGKVLVAGGGGNGGPLNSAEIY